MQEIALLPLVIQAGSTQFRMVNKALFTYFVASIVLLSQFQIAAQRKEFLPIDLS